MTSENNFSNYILIVGAYSKTPKLYSMEIITTEEVMDTFHIFQARFGKMYEFGWWDLEIISSNVRKQFTSMELQDECQTRSVRLMLEALDHQ